MQTDKVPGDEPVRELDRLRGVIRHTYRVDEQQCVSELLKQARLQPQRERVIQQTAGWIAAAARESSFEQRGVEAFLREYDLSSQEGVLLMCLAEALLRIPDADTADRLIKDRLCRGQWDEHLGTSGSLLVNASTWGMLLTGQLLADPQAAQHHVEQRLSRLVARLGEPLVRKALQQAMRVMAHQFVMGRDIHEALDRSHRTQAVRYSFDCLGEAALTAADVERYDSAYQDAIEALGSDAPRSDGLLERASISVKLSALHPRYEYAQRSRVMKELLPRLQRLAERAATAGIGLTVDAEEAARLELSLDLFQAVFNDARVSGWEGLGIAVQAYQKRALPVLHWLNRLAADARRLIPVRLVKGAYWDSEIKRAQALGLDGYPVFTRKAATDVSFLACARYLLQNTERLYAQIASHNALTIAWIDELAGGRPYELQRLHGMGESLYKKLGDYLPQVPPVRIYAPIGGHEELLPYLVRRLLENGANSSFINQLNDRETDIQALVDNPCERIAEVNCLPHPHIPLPKHLFGERRRNSCGTDLSDPLAVEALQQQMAAAAKTQWHAAPIVAGKAVQGQARSLLNPASGAVIGAVVEADADSVEAALGAASAAARDWDACGARERADILRRCADLYEQEMAALAALIVAEGGRCMADAVAEIREAVDFCRYYAAEAEQDFSAPALLPGPTGERNELSLHGRGVFACISPWNFPLAIFTGQIAAALAAGNAVVAKPARQTPLVAHAALRLMHRAGVPETVLHLLPGDGPTVGARLCADPRLAGVVFTGSTATAWNIQRTLAGRNAPIAPLIAETGGQNMMIADSSALPEQLVSDVVRSAFNSAGQRCSALRVLYLQNEIAERTLELLGGALEELRVDDPWHLHTDVGPVIDWQAHQRLEQHAARMRSEARLLVQLENNQPSTGGSFFMPRIFELTSLDVLHEEVFGPVLHVIRFAARDLEAVVDAANRTAYGLTMGVHSRIEDTWQRVRARARVGNLYINRDMIGAAVGSQPFGGEGLSGTGPKAGGPNYLKRFSVERTCTINTAAVGGNTGLLSMEDEA